jgi:hypothetical protein
MWWNLYLVGKVGWSGRRIFGVLGVVCGVGRLSGKVG